VRWLFALLVLVWPISAPAGPLDKLTFYTESFPPYQYVKDGELTGIHIDLARAVFQVADAELSVADIRLVPWARGYNVTLSTPNTVIFGTGRKPSREDKFIWVGPLTPGRNVILARRGVAEAAPTSLDGYQDKMIATVRDDASEHLLLSGGVPNANLRRQPDPDAVVSNLLKPGRVDYWAYNLSVARFVLKQHGMAAGFVPVLTMDVAGNYFAVNPKSDPEAVAALREALATVRNSRRYETIIAKYQ